MLLVIPRQEDGMNTVGDGTRPLSMLSRLTGVNIDWARADGNNEHRPPILGVSHTVKYLVVVEHVHRAEHLEANCMAHEDEVYQRSSGDRGGTAGQRGDPNHTPPDSPPHSPLPRSFCGDQAVVGCSRLHQLGCSLKRSVVFSCMTPVACRQES